jgi:translocator protein
VTFARYTWAAPCTLFGLLLAGWVGLAGGRVGVTAGVIEAALPGRPAWTGRFGAITFGHVVLAASPSALARLRRHEHAHVRQYERWGLLFLPAYALSSAAQWLRGRDPHWHNRFEVQARACAGEVDDCPPSTRASAGAEWFGPLPATGEPAMQSRSRALIGLFGWMALAYSAAAIGAAASIDAAGFYAALDRPRWAPPGSWFGPVWTVLYGMMGVAAWLVWRRAGLHAGRTALGLFVLQLALNALWSWLFFGWRLGAAAMGEVLLLWIAIIATLMAFWRISRPAGVLLMPYLAWVSFAAALTFSIWQRNPGLLG